MSYFLVFFAGEGLFTTCNEEESTTPNFVIYKRLLKREKLDVSFLQAAMYHPMEMNVPELRIYAHLVLQNASKGEMVSKVMNLLLLKKFDT